MKGLWRFERSGHYTTFLKDHQAHLQANKKFFILIFFLALIYFIVDTIICIETNGLTNFPIFILAVVFQFMRAILFLFYMKIAVDNADKRFMIVEILLLIVFGISTIITWELQIDLDSSRTYIVGSEAAWTFLYIHTLFILSYWKAILFISTSAFGVYRMTVTSDGVSLGMFQSILQVALVLIAVHIEECWKKQKLLQNSSLEKTGQTLRNILNSLPDNIAILNLEGDIRFFNDYFGISFKLSNNEPSSVLFSKIYQVKPRERHLNLQKLQERYNFVRPTKKNSRKSQVRPAPRASLIRPEDSSGSVLQYLTEEFKTAAVRSSVFASKEGQSNRNRTGRLSKMGALKTLTEFFNSINHFKDLQEVLEFMSVNADIIRTYTEKERSFFIFDAKYNTNEGILKSYEIKISLSNFDDEESFIMILRDTTHRDIIVTLEDNNNFKDSVLSSISHELRTPLNANLNLLQLAIDAYDTTRTEKSSPSRSQTLQIPGEIHHGGLIALDNLEKIKQDFKDSYLIPAHKSGKMLESLINDIVDYSMLLAHKFVSNLKQKYLAKSIDKIKYVCEFQAQRKNIEFEVNINPEINFKIGTDHRRLRQILLNLINNAIKFTNHGGVTLDIDTYCGNHELIQFTVSDTGIGMDTSTVGRITSLLETGNFLNKLNHDSSGVGLGLSISHLLAKEIGPNASRMSGIKIESTENEGSKFWFIVENCKKKGDNRMANLLDDTNLLQVQRDNTYLNNLNNSRRRSGLARSSIDSGRSQRSEYPIWDKNSPIDKIIIIPVSDEEVGDDSARVIRDANLQKNTAETGAFSPSMGSKKNNLQVLTFKDSLICLSPPENSSPPSTRSRFAPSNFSQFKSIPVLVAADNQVDIPEEDSVKTCACPEILVVDDDMFNLFTMENILVTLNFRIEKATNGKEAIEAVKKRHDTKCCEQCKGFMLIFMDISMPIMDGFEATLKLKEMMKSGEISEVPIVACTAFVEDEKIMKCYECGMSDKVSKPVNRNKLKEVLKKYKVVGKQDD